MRTIIKILVLTLIVAACDKADGQSYGSGGQGDGNGQTTVTQRTSRKLYPSCRNFGIGQPLACLQKQCEAANGTFEDTYCDCPGEKVFLGWDVGKCVALKALDFGNDESYLGGESTELFGSFFKGMNQRLFSWIQEGDWSWRGALSVPGFYKPQKGKVYMISDEKDLTVEKFNESFIEQPILFESDLKAEIEFTSMYYTPSEIE